MATLTKTEFGGLTIVDNLAKAENIESYVEGQTGKIIYYGTTDVVQSSEDMFNIDSNGAATLKATYRSTLTEVVVPYEIGGTKVTSLGDSCFENCASLVSAVIPSSVVSLGTYCFYGCSKLVSVSIPASVVSLGNYCFDSCAFASIEIPDGVQSLGDGCFVGCSSLTSVKVPDSVVLIGENCFQQCASLASVTLPDSLPAVPGYCFANCTSVTSIKIPKSAASIGNYCFGECTALKSIHVDSDVSLFNADNLEGAPADLVIYVDDPVYGTTYPETVESRTVVVRATNQDIAEVLGDISTILSQINGN